MTLLTDFNADDARTVYPMDSRQHAQECAEAGDIWPCSASAMATRANPVDFWLERSAVVETAGSVGVTLALPSWRMSQGGIDVRKFSWEEHCGALAATDITTDIDTDDQTGEQQQQQQVGRCLDGCVRVRGIEAVNASPSASASTPGSSSRMVIGSDVLPSNVISAGSDGLALAIFNAKKPDEIGDALLGFGLIGLYVTFVYSVSKMVRMLIFY